jgi:hypothetical protein
MSEALHEVVLGEESHTQQQEMEGEEGGVQQEPSSVVREEGVEAHPSGKPATRARNSARNTILMTRRQCIIILYYNYYILHCIALDQKSISPKFRVGNSQTELG